MSRRHTLIAVMACGAFAAGCGDDDTDATSKREAKPVDVAARSAELEKNPYDLRCADIRDKVASARMTRQRNRLHIPNRSALFVVRLYWPGGD